MAEFMAFVFASLAGAVLTAAVRQMALKGGVMDLPNARSSHAVPVPRGGGIAIVVVCIVGALLLGTLGILEFRHAMLLAVSGSAIAAVGAVDDLKGLSPRYRFAVHLVASAAFLAGLWWERIAGGELVGVFLLGAALVFAMAWAINLYNFMDGIDGIAASQTMFVAGASALFALLNGAPTATMLPLLTAGASLGFLFWNWSPARIFMGDVGSGFLGFWLAALGIWLSFTGAVGIWTSILLNGVFVGDASATLLRRMITGKRWYEAHRSHVYQQLSRRWQSHAKVAIAFQLVNLVFVLPLALLSWAYPAWAPWLAVSGVAALTILAAILRGGASTDAKS